MQQRHPLTPTQVPRLVARLCSVLAARTPSNLPVMHGAIAFLYAGTNSRAHDHPTHNNIIIWIQVTIQPSKATICGVWCGRRGRAPLRLRYNLVTIWTSLSSNPTKGATWTAPGVLSSLPCMASGMPQWGTATARAGRAQARPRPRSQAGTSQPISTSGTHRIIVIVTRTEDTMKRRGMSVGGDHGFINMTLYVGSHSATSSACTVAPRVAAAALSRAAASPRVLMSIGSTIVGGASFGSRRVHAYPPSIR